MEINENENLRTEWEDQYEREERARKSRRRSGFGFLLVAAIFGLIGGLLSPYVERGFQRPAGPGSPARDTERVGVVAEDQWVTDLVEKNSPGVVSIVISKEVSQVRNFGGFPFFFDPFDEQGQSPEGATEKRRIGSGSGFLVTKDGLIVTNKHVVSDAAADYTVTMTGGKEYSATVLARDPVNDIAILKIDGVDFPALTLGDSDQIKVGQTAVAIGNPLGEFANSVSRGIISGVGRNVTAGGNVGESELLSNIIQTDAAINPGNSGGPLFNLTGEVIGVNVAMAEGAENIGFALPINQVKRIVEQVRTTGKISTPYIGVRYVAVDDEIQKNNNLPYNYGALVLRGQNMTDFAVIPGSPADKAGLMENDIILEVNGNKIDAEHPLASRINEYKVGDEVNLKVWSKGSTKDVKLTLEERQQSSQ